MAISGMLWSAIDKFAVQFGQFIVGIVLARILMPEDFGLVGMLSIFIAISQVFINSGMGSGLIQRQNRTKADFSTVFIFNLVVSIFFYCVLFISAPYIANFYNQPLLIPLTRILGINLIISSLAIVQRSKLTIAIDFKSIAKVNVIGVIIGGTAGIVAAKTGFGVWSLVIQTLLGSAATVGSLWFFSHWKPSLVFSKESFKALFGYGSKILVSGLYAQVLQNIYNITIGKAYPASELGYYTRTKQFADISSGTITSILDQVTFPILSSLQDDKVRLVSIYSRLIRMSSFFVFPIMALIALLAKPIVILLLTEKWVALIPLLQWMVFARIFYPISAINMNILKAIGRSDLYMKVDLSKFPLIILALVITIPLGVKAIIIGHVVTSAISFFINAYMPGKLFNYGGLKQLRDMLPYMFSTAVMVICVYFSIMFIDSLILKLSIGGIVGAFSYWLMANILKVEELKEMKSLMIKIVKRNSQNGKK
jgi:O-antigen/teichoic acid export membrane protein